MYQLERDILKTSRQLGGIWRNINMK
jgi:hypothetical protein